MNTNYSVFYLSDRGQIPSAQTVFSVFPKSKRMSRAFSFFSCEYDQFQKEIAA